MTDQEREAIIRRVFHKHALGPTRFRGHGLQDLTSYVLTHVFNGTPYPTGTLVVSSNVRGLVKI